MNLFGNLKSDGLEESEDRLGGYAPKKTSIYNAKVKALYAGASAGGAQNLTLIATLSDGSEYRETIYITNKKGENFWIDGKNGNKRMPLPGFTLMDDLCLMTTDKPLSEQAAVEKVLNIYDKDAGKEIPKPVQMLMDVVGQEVSLAIQFIRENKTEKNEQSGEYEPVAEERTLNALTKVFHTATKLTVAEARKGLTAGEFWDQWLERNEGKEVDKRTIKDGVAPAKGKPAKAAPAAGAPAATTARPSLFGNK